MPEPDVLYADVKFKTKRNARETASSLRETTYSEVRVLKTEPPAEPSASQQEVSNRPSNVRERVFLLVLCALLAAAVIGLAIDNFQTKNNLQALKSENKNLTENLSKTKPVATVQPVCPTPKFTEVKNESCLRCEEGWKLHGGKCYYFSTNTSTWTQSRDECRRQGGDLVKIDSREEQSFLELSLREKMNKDEDKFWIGLTDSKKEGKWLWVDDSPLDTSFWSAKEPDNWTGENPEGEDCVRMGERGGDLKCWFDKSCKELQRRICEKAAESGHQRVVCLKSS